VAGFDRIIFTRHFWERYRRIAWGFPKSKLRGLGDFLKTEGIFYVSRNRDNIFVSVIGVVLVLRKHEGRFILVTCYPGDWRRYPMSSPKVCTVSVSLNQEQKERLSIIQQRRGYERLADAARRAIEEYLAKYYPRPKQREIEPPKTINPDLRVIHLSPETRMLLAPLEAAERRKKDAAYKARMNP